MSSLRSTLTIFAAALYVLLGISASWHAPHFSRGEAAIGVDAHGGEHETALDGESCALCSTKKSAQETLAAVGAAPWTVSVPSTLITRETSVVEVVFGPARARAPPALS